MRIRRGLLLGLARLLAAVGSPSALADVEGLVTTAGGRPVEGAVVAAGDGAYAVTDGRGRFVLRGIDPPLTLRVDDARFETAVVSVAAGATGPLVLSLEPKQAVFEQVVVTARPAATAVAPVSASTTPVERDDLAAPVRTLVDMAVEAPGVAESGQGGRFQAYSVRGVTGQRVFTTVAGVRIVTERRAGATASFVDPALIGSVEVVRGPASTLFGSGALGGVVQALPRRFSGPEVEIGYASQGAETSLVAGWGGDRATFAFAGRDAGDGNDGDGAVLFNHSTQWSALLTREWEQRGWTFDLLVLPARAQDVAKPNTRYPARTTRYPEENHLLLRLGARHGDGLRLAAFVHPNDLETENLRATSRSVVRNAAFDFGVDAQRELSVPRGVTALVGAELFGRRGVTATEENEDLTTGVVTLARTLDGAESQVAVFGTLRHAAGRATLEAGARATWVAQSNLGASSHDAAGAGFFGATVPLAGGFELAANAGIGLRFPSLSERFFSGATGRGEVVANEDLRPERSLSVDLGLRYFGRRLYVELFGFRNEIDDYIEQVEVMPGVDGFANLTAGTIVGLDADGWLALTPRLTLTWAGTWIRGESDGGADLADVPAARLAAGLRAHVGPWRAATRIERRFSKRDPGPGEQATDGATLVSLSLRRELRRGFALRGWVTNLLDATYLPSADELAVPAPGRSVGVAVAWASVPRTATKGPVHGHPGGQDSGAEQP